MVYFATDMALRRQVAVKTLPTVSLAHAHALRREARAMAALSHPNLATIYAVDAWRGTPLLLVEFRHGGTLQDAQVTMVELRHDLQSLRDLLAPQAPLRRDLATALTEIAEAARAIGALADFLTRHPDALLRGRRLDEPKP